MRFKTGFVLGCAAGVYVTQKVRQLRAPLAGPTWMAAPPSDWRRPSVPGKLGGEMSVEKVRAIGDLARERATDLLRSPVGDLAHERVIALFESAIAAQRPEAARRY